MKYQKTSKIMRAMINEQGIAHYEVARKLGICPAHLSRMLNGKRAWTWENVRAVARMCGVADLRDLLIIWGGENENNNN